MSIRAILIDLFGTLVPCYPLDRLTAVLDAMARDVGVPCETFAAEWDRTFPARLRGEFATVENNLRHVLERLG
jgi:putative hydrolase of the HAD superfamily